MTRILNGTVYVEEFIATGNSGEYTFTTGIYDNQSDATGDGALDLRVNDLMYIQALDPISALLVPGVFNRYKITSISNQTGNTFDAVILWDEPDIQTDEPSGQSYSIICRPSDYCKYGLPSSGEVYFNLQGGGADYAFNLNFKDISDLQCTGLENVTGYQGHTGAMGVTGAQGKQGVTGVGATGVQGVRGSTGSQGFTGVQGIQGSTGIKGSTGSIGIQGIQGITGIIGNQGFTGSQGFTGVAGIRKIVKNKQK